jgi:hypothetical protein
MSATYTVSFNGVRKEKSLQETSIKLASIFKRPIEEIERMLSSGPYEIKKGLDEKTAEKYKLVIENAGAIVEIKNESFEIELPIDDQFEPVAKALITSSANKLPREIAESENTSTSTCYHCKSTNSISAKFCNSCGKSIVENSLLSKEAASAPPNEKQINGNAVGEGEYEVWKEKASMKDFLVTPTLWLLTLITLGLYFVIVYLVRLNTRYTLTNQRLIKEFGLLSKSVDEIELFRVKDIKAMQGLFQRFVGLGNIVVMSSDASGTFVMECIPDALKKREQVRAMAQKSKEAKGVRMMINE